MQSRSGHPRNFKLISKFSKMRPVFPDYLSVSYDYDLSELAAHLYAHGSIFHICHILQKAVNAVFKRYSYKFQRK